MTASPLDIFLSRPDRGIERGAFAIKIQVKLASNDRDKGITATRLAETVRVIPRWIDTRNA
jgi:hypothetical protein